MVRSPEKLLAELIALPSVNPAFLPPGDNRAGEWRVADFLAATGAKAGLDIEQKEVLTGKGPTRARHNLLVRLSPSAKARSRVILAPHLDTVGPSDMEGDCFKPHKSGDRLHGRGACDTKGSVAAMFAALLRVTSLVLRPKETEILFVGLVDEENGQEGSRAFAASGTRADLALIGEPTELKVVTAHKGDMWLKLVTHGKAAHGAKPELGENAVYRMARVIDLLESDYAAELRTRSHPLLGRPTINVGMVRGGTQPNIVPDRCEIEVDRRTIPGESDPAIQSEIVAFLKTRGAPVELIDSKGKPCRPMETDSDLPLVRKLMGFARQRAPVGVDFFCDAAILSSAKIPSIVFGPGNIAQAHTADEWISIRSLNAATEILTRFLRSLP